MYNARMAIAKKQHSQFVCQQCGYSQVSWSGKCPNCGSWNSMVETKMGMEDKKLKSSRKSIEPVSLSSVSSKNTSRITTKITELDRVLGGGMVLGQVILLAGEPGIGKSTILTQLANNLGNTLYIAGEESASQIKIRADRLKVKSEIFILEETDVDAAIDSAGKLIDKNGIKLLVVDSIQTTQTQDLSGMAGSVGQVRECAYRLMLFAKKTGIPTILVGHVTKEGSVAGPAVLAHLVDTVLWFEGDKTSTFRIMRANKNRFGPTDEAGLFLMEDQGLISIDNPSTLFASGNFDNVAGSARAVIMEGTRPILIEIQSLVVPTKLPFPRRVVQGIDTKKIELLLAVLTRRCSLKISEYDVFVNVVGGFAIREPAADLAISLSLASAYFDKPLPKNFIAIGEVGLLGEIRQVIAEGKRIKEVKRLGFIKIANHKNVTFLNAAIKKLF